MAMQRFDINTMRLRRCFPEETEVIKKEAAEATDETAFQHAADFFVLYSKLHLKVNRGNLIRTLLPLDLWPLGGVSVGVVVV